MPQALFNGQVIADSDTVETVEGNLYFPPQSIRAEYFRPSEKTTICGWKGKARYYTLVVDGVENTDAAWYYPEPKPAAANIKDHVAFYPSVEVRP